MISGRGRYRVVSVDCTTVRQEVSSCLLLPVFGPLEITCFYVKTKVDMCQKSPVCESCVYFYTHLSRATAPHCGVTVRDTVHQHVMIRQLNHRHPFGSEQSHVSPVSSSSNRSSHVSRERRFEASLQSPRGARCVCLCADFL